MTAALFSACGSSSSSSSSQDLSGGGEQQSNSRVQGVPSLSSLQENSYLNGALYSKNGPFITDRFGRVVTLHGTNAVYKLPPYSLTVKPNQPNSLANPDAQRMSALGFNLARVGVIWAGVEPGKGGPNQTQVCTQGAATNPGMWNQKVANAYLDQVEQVVNELGRHHIYSLIDMHQDVWSSVFGGEGAPAWATCTNGLPIPATVQCKTAPCRWSDAYGEPSEIAAWNNFWDNSVIGGLQQQYQKSWAAVAKRFANNPWVVGYDPINEPSAMNNVVVTPQYDYTASLSCLYGGRNTKLVAFNNKTKIPCPAGVPNIGLIQTIQSNDPKHLVMPEVDNAVNPNGGKTLYLATTPSLSGLVYNFHVYCPYRSGVTGNAKNQELCSSKETTSMVNNVNRRALYASTLQPFGPAIIMSEFGATSNQKLSSLLALDAGSLGLSWAWWSWRYYSDPTGSSAEALVQADDQLSPAGSALTQTYAMAVAGIPVDAQSDPLNGQFTLVWQTNPEITAPTTIFLDPMTFQYPYCTYVTGGRITSKPGAAMVTVQNSSKSELAGIRVVPGKCVKLK